MGLLLKANEVPWSDPVNHHVYSGEDWKIEVAMVYGEKSNLMVGRRGPGYHSKPHRHESEQLNYCISGQIHIYIDDDVYVLEPGGFLRVPAWATHWAWNRGDEDNVLVESHTPTTSLDGNAPFALPLFLDQETPRLEQAKPIEYLSGDLGTWLEERVEEKASEPSPT